MAEKKRITFDDGLYKEPDGRVYHKDGTPKLDFGPADFAKYFEVVTPQSEYPEELEKPSEEEQKAQEAFYDAKAAYDEALLTQFRVGRKIGAGTKRELVSARTFLPMGSEIPNDAREIQQAAQALVEETRERLKKAQIERNRLHRERDRKRRAWMIDKQRKLDAERRAGRQQSTAARDKVRAWLKRQGGGNGKQA